MISCLLAQSLNCVLVIRYEPIFGGHYLACLARISFKNNYLPTTQNFACKCWRISSGVTMRTILILRRNATFVLLTWRFGGCRLCEVDQLAIIIWLHTNGDRGPDPPPHSCVPSFNIKSIRFVCTSYAAPVSTTQPVSRNLQNVWRVICSSVHTKSLRWRFEIASAWLRRFFVYLVYPTAPCLPLTLSFHSSLFTQIVLIWKPFPSLFSLSSS
jgi:hypothetical protein